MYYAMISFHYFTVISASFNVLSQQLEEKILTHLPDSAFSASSELDDQRSASNSRLYEPGSSLLLSESSWYANEDILNPWIEVNFGTSTLFNKITIAPAYPLDRAEFVKISTIFCGLVDFSVRAIGRFYFDEAVVASFDVGVWYCQTVRLLAYTWENALALRWDFHHIIGTAINYISTHFIIIISIGTTKN